MRVVSVIALLALAAGLLVPRLSLAGSRAGLDVASRIAELETQVQLQANQIATLQGQVGGQMDTTNPWLGLHYVISLFGVYPLGGGFGSGGAAVGEIRLAPYGFVPDGWAACDGQILSIAQNTALFSLLGTTFGGNGQTTFALPDLSSRVVRGIGQGPGLPAILLGEQGGG